MIASITEKAHQGIKSIFLKKIDVDDESFRMTFCPDLKELQTSMEAVGLINPVILRGKENFQIVSGYRRILVARRLGWKKIAARVYTLDELDFEEGFNLNFYENLGTRSFNLIESSIVVAGFVDRCGTDIKPVREKILPLMGFQSGSKVFQQLFSLVRLVDEWKDLVVKKEISLPNAAKVSGFSPEDQKVLYSALSGLKLGQNKMRECLEMVEEVGKGEEVSLHQLFTSEPFTSLNQNARINITERTEMFRKALRTRRYPELTRQQEKFKAVRKKLLLPPSVSLEPPEFFEGDKLKVTFRFRSPEELRSILEKLETAVEREALKGLLGML